MVETAKAIRDYSNGPGRNDGSWDQGVVVGVGSVQTVDITQWCAGEGLPWLGRSSFHISGFCKLPVKLLVA